MSRFKSVGPDTVECPECGEIEAMVTVDELAGVAGFNCPSCDRMQPA